MQVKHKNDKIRFKSECENVYSSITHLLTLVMVEDLIAIAILTIQMRFQSEIVYAMIRVWVLHFDSGQSVNPLGVLIFSWDYG